MYCSMIETSLVVTRKSSGIFGHLQQSSRNVRLAFDHFSENFRKYLESVWKSSVNRKKVFIGMFI